jgi:hypothetical protein
MPSQCSASNGSSTINGITSASSDAQDTAAVDATSNIPMSKDEAAQEKHPHIITR